MAVFLGSPQHHSIFWFTLCELLTPPPTVIGLLAPSYLKSTKRLTIPNKKCYVCATVTVYFKSLLVAYCSYLIEKMNLFNAR